MIIIVIIIIGYSTERYKCWQQTVPKVGYTVVTFNAFANEMHLWVKYLDIKHGWIKNGYSVHQN